MQTLAAEDPDPATAAGARLELLAKLVEDYEKTRFPFEKPDPIDAILFRMEQRGLRQKDIAELLGGKNRASEVLARKRPLTLPMIRSLYERLDIPAGLLIQEASGTYAPFDGKLGTKGGSQHDEIPTSSAVEDVYFSADVETDGPIPGPYSLLSFGLVLAGRFDGRSFNAPTAYGRTFYRELKPISDEFEPEALAVNGLDRDGLMLRGSDPADAMTEAAEWVRQVAGAGRPVLVAFPLSFDWTWLYWYFVRYSRKGSPFNHSSCFDIKTAYAVKARLPIANAGKNKISADLRSSRPHTHNALDDAIEQAEIFSKVFGMAFASPSLPVNSSMQRTQYSKEPLLYAERINKNDEPRNSRYGSRSRSAPEVLKGPIDRLAGKPGRGK